MTEASKKAGAPSPAGAEAAISAALDAAMVAHDVAIVVSIALATDNGGLSIHGQEAVRTVALYGAEKAREARNAIDRAGGLLRTGDHHG